MDWCHDHGLPLSHVSDDNGWSAQDLDALLWWLEDREARCGRCGTRRTDNERLDEDGDWVALAEPRYEVVLGECITCSRMHRVMDESKDSRRGGDRPRLVTNPRFHEHT